MIMQSYDFDRRFAGVSRLYGEDRLEIFKKSHICIVGIGGVGSWVAESLARHGIGKITLIDMDHIAESNINRQIQALDSTLGSSKIETMSLRIKDINPKSIVKGDDVPIRIEKKTFYKSSTESSIFEQCGLILQKENDGLFEYNTDGLIFTPSLYAVGANNEKDKATNPIKTTWEHSFKWKPAVYNTIDFLISVKKLPSGDDFVGNLFKTGISANSNVQIEQYKTLILRVGFDEKIHGYINPCKNVLDDELPNVNNPDEDEGYRPMQFYPTNPSDNDAGICNIMLKESSNGEKIMMTKEGEIIEDNMIVEFSYEKENENK